MATFLTDKAPFNLNDPSTGTSGALSVGFTEITATGAATFTLPTPYVGAYVCVTKVSTDIVAAKIEVGATATQTLDRDGSISVTLGRKGEYAAFIGRSSLAWVPAGNGGASVGPTFA